ncbi:MAG: hypothetical protein R6X34_04920 [Chloroflexota bacterium]
MTLAAPRQILQYRTGLPALIVLLACLLYVGFALEQLHWDPLGFATYDGHFSYQIALRFLEAPPYLDVPAYRFQRITYPIIVRLLSFAQPEIVPWMLIGVNIAAIVVGTWAMEKLLTGLRISGWYALVYGLYGAQMVGLRTNLTEPVAMMFVMLGILAWEKERHWWSAAAFALAILGKEPMIVFPAAFGLVCLVKRDWKWMVVLAGTAVPYILMQLFLWQWLGEPGLGSGGDGATPFPRYPLGGWLEISQVNLQGFLLISLIIVPMSIIPTIAGLALSIRDIVRRLNHPYVYCVLLNCLAILFLPRSTFQEPAAMVRLTQGLMVSLLLYGAWVTSKRILNYSVLWIFTNVLLIKGVA